MPKSKNPETKLMISQDQAPPKARRIRQMERQLVKQVVAEAMQQEEIVRKQDVEDAVFVQMIQHGSYRINGTIEESLARSYVWDRGLTGFSMAELASELCEELEIPSTDVVRRGAVKVKVSNMARVPRDFRKMMGFDPAENVAIRLTKLVDEFLGGRHEEGALDALRRAGLYKLLQQPEDSNATLDGNDPAV